MKWIKFNPKAVNLPKAGRFVLVQFEGSSFDSPAVCVGYLKRWSGNNVFFVVPGCNMGGREITHWSDCLGNDFYAPLFLNTT